MTYGRARLWLGVTGVGSIVMIATTLLMSGGSRLWFEQQRVFGPAEFKQLATFIIFFSLWLTPFDFLGGYYFPVKFRKSEQSLGKWLQNYIPAALIQAFVFIVFGSLIVLASQALGTLAGLVSVVLFSWGCLFARNRLILTRICRSDESTIELEKAIRKVHAWRISTPRIAVVEHNDRGFTGGLIGSGRRAIIVIPQAWLAFDTDTLATVIARRAWAFHSGSYRRGLIVALAWNLAGFLLAISLPGAGLTSISGLVTTLCWFTLWSFAGLLILPTVSRNASLKIDQELVLLGVPAELISEAASSMDQLQDDEPVRSQFIETIFHPVPSVSGRSCSRPVSGFAAWNAARMALFLSWGCLGFLSRSVHCNVGRPELWTMLPVD